MRIATWNINGLRARLDFVLHWLRSRRPDVVGIQELKLEDEHFPYDTFREEGYYALAHGQKAWNGVAVLSRSPLDLVQQGLPGCEDLGARLMAVQVNELAFATVYVPNGKTVKHPDFQQKLEWLDSLDRWIRDHYGDQEAFVLGGDFNICPAPIDSWNEPGLKGKIFHTDEERKRLRRLSSWGLVDVFRREHPQRQAFSWWDYRAGAFHRKQGLRIDLLLATSPVASRVTAAEIDRDYRKKKDGLTASDHAPVWIDLKSG